MPEPETIIKLPGTVTPASHVRSTLIQSSLKQLKASGHFEAYLRQLPHTRRSEIIDTLGPCWLSMDLALMHYRACDDLGLSPSEMQQIGEAVGSKLNSTLLSTLTRLAKLSGLTPWQFYGQIERLWKRTFQGGAVGLKRLGVTESQIDVRGLALCRYRYFRYAFAGAVTSIANLTASHAKTVVVEDGPDMLVLRGTWSESTRSNDLKR